MKEKNESAISRQTDVQRKMNARGNFETTFFFLFSLIPLYTSELDVH